MITIHSALVRSGPLHCHPNGDIKGEAVVCHDPHVAVTLQRVRISNGAACFFDASALSVCMARTIAELLNNLANEAEIAHEKLVKLNK